jgi:ribose/xylose/arabinose/galactoside ABC-type transport system permease subunit
MAEKPKKKMTFLSFFNSVILGHKAIVLIIIFFISLSIMSPVFLTSRNILNVLRQVCVNSILACGFVLIMGNGGVDLSCGSVIGLTGVSMALMMKIGTPFLLAIFIAMLIGAAVESINGFSIVFFKLPPFIVTLGMQQVLRGSTYLLTKMQPITGLPVEFVWIGQGYVGPIPFPIFVMLAVTIIMWVIINRTKFGRYALACGGNTEAARVSGINVGFVRIRAYATMGMVAAVASAVMCARAASAQPAGGTGMEMEAIAAGTIGGSKMQGGNANIVGALLGAVIVGLLNNGLNLMGINASWQIVAKGLLILFAMILDSASTMMLEKLKLQQSA